MNERARRWTPSTATYVMAAGHTAWGLAAHRDQIPGILADLPGSVGDGIFDNDHSRDERATAFWFLFVGLLVALLGRVYSAAEAADDRRTMRATGRAVAVICAAGCLIVPRSGFPAGLALGTWMTRWSRR